MTIRAVCFDLGGVVVRIHRTWEAAVEAAGLNHGTPAPWKDQTVVGQWQAAHLAHHRGEITNDEYFECVSKLSQGFYSSEDVARIHRHWLIDEYEGVGALIDALNELDLATGCLSNTNASHWETMRTEPAFSAVPRLGVRLASHELQLLKPDAPIYEAAERAFACSPSQIAFFDDLAENVAAARARGWQATRIDPLGSPAEQIRSALAALDVHVDEARGG